MRTYTVVALYLENDQSYITTVEASRPENAVADAHAGAESDLRIICVFEGTPPIAWDEMNV